jgi:hypothetical protein
MSLKLAAVCRCRHQSRSATEPVGSDERLAQQEAAAELNKLAHARLCLAE